MHDTHTHCSCNGVWLCRTCHEWVHSHPFEARAGGWIVSRHGSPSGTPTTAYFGPIILDCIGAWSVPSEEEHEA